MPAMVRKYRDEKKGEPRKAADEVIDDRLTAPHTTLYASYRPKILPRHLAEPYEDKRHTAFSVIIPSV